jgi:hypothetical protein
MSGCVDQKSSKKISNPRSRKEDIHQLDEERKRRWKLKHSTPINLLYLNNSKKFSKTAGAFLHRRTPPSCRTSQSSITGAEAIWKTT